MEVVGDSFLKSLWESTVNVWNGADSFVCREARPEDFYDGAKGVFDMYNVKKNLILRSLIEQHTPTKQESVQAPTQQYLER